MKKQEKVSLDHYNTTLSVLISLLFAFIFERLNDIRVNIMTVNYYIGKSLIDSTDFLYDLISKSSDLSKITILNSIFLFIFFIELLYFINLSKEYSNTINLNRFNIIMNYCIFIWLFLTFTSFLGSITNFNILIYPQQNIGVDLERDLSTVIVDFIYSIVFMKTISYDFLLMGMSTLILSFFYLFVPPKRNNFVFLTIFILSLLLGAGMLYNQSKIPELVFQGKYVVSPAGPDAFIGPMFSDLFMLIKNSFVALYCILTLSNIFLELRTKKEEAS